MSGDKEDIIDINEILGSENDKKKVRAFKASKHTNAILEVLSNKYRRYIITLLNYIEYKEKAIVRISISDLMRDLNALASKGEKIDHRTLRHHLKVLEQNGLIRRERVEDKKGRPVYISLNRKHYSDVNLEFNLKGEKFKFKLL